jgi:hypothetical protein
MFVGAERRYLSEASMAKLYTTGDNELVAARRQRRIGTEDQPQSPPLGTLPTDSGGFNRSTHDLGGSARISLIYEGDVH